MIKNITYNFVVFFLFTAQRTYVRAKFRYTFGHRKGGFANVFVAVVVYDFAVIPCVFRGGDKRSALVEEKLNSEEIQAAISAAVPRTTTRSTSRPR